MLESVSLDQLRIFIAAADEGSFSAAGRKLCRAQSVVSQAISTLEGQLGLSLFDRSNRRPQLTEQGRALLAEARTVAEGMDVFKARAREFASGLETELTIAIDAMFPIEALQEPLASFAIAFPSTPLRLYARALGGVVEALRGGRCEFGITGSQLVIPPEFVREPLPSVPMITVVAPPHPLSRIGGGIPFAEMERHIQLVLSDRSSLTHDRKYGGLSAKTWLLPDLRTKYAFLKAGLGWGRIPLAVVADDLERGLLVEIAPEGMLPTGSGMMMNVVYPGNAPPGPAGRWLIKRLRHMPASLPMASHPAPEPMSRARRGKSGHRSPRD